MYPSEHSSKDPSGRATVPRPELAGPDFDALEAKTDAPEEMIDPSSRAIAQRFAPLCKQPTFALRPGPRPSLLPMPPLPTPVRAEPGAHAGPATYQAPPLTILKRPGHVKGSEQPTQSALQAQSELSSSKGRLLTFPS